MRTRWLVIPCAFGLGWLMVDPALAREGKQVTARELGVSKAIAGVNMRLNAGGVRELHWHKQAKFASCATKMG